MAHAKSASTLEKVDDPLETRGDEIVWTKDGQLKDMLGQPVFRRSEAGATLTPAGARFRPFAEKLVRTWEHARQDVGLPAEFSQMLTVGAES